eukprot:PhF_6_TR27151/c0_g1_i1/m.39657
MPPSSSAKWLWRMGCSAQDFLLKTVSNQTSKNEFQLKPKWDSAIVAQGTLSFDPYLQLGLEIQVTGWATAAGTARITAQGVLSYSSVSECQLNLAINLYPKLALELTLLKLVIFTIKVFEGYAVATMQWPLAVIPVYSVCLVFKPTPAPTPPPTLPPTPPPTPAPPTVPPPTYFYNSDGLGFSPTNLTSSSDKPISDPVAMISYNAWPGGAVLSLPSNDTSQGTFVTGGAFAGGVSIMNNRYIILAPYFHSSVVRLDTLTSEMVGFNQWPIDFAKGKTSFVGAVYDGVSVWLVPYEATHLIKVNPNTGSIQTGYNKWPSTPNSIGSPKYCGGIYDGRNVWLVPSNGDSVIRVDPAGNMLAIEINYFRENNYARRNEQGAIHDPDKSNIWGWAMGPWSNRLSAISRPPSQTFCAFAGGIFDGQRIWFVPWNYVDNIVALNIVFPWNVAVFKWPSFIAPSAKAFQGGVTNGIDVWFVQRRSSAPVKHRDREDDRIQELAKWVHKG